MEDKKVKLIDNDGVLLGVVTMAEAIRKAQEQDLDLVEIAQHGDIAVYRILDYGRYKYRKQLKEKKTKQNDMKEIKMSPCINVSDLDIKVKKIKKFLIEGKKVNLGLTIKRKHRGKIANEPDFLEKIAFQFSDIAVVDKINKNKRQILLISKRKKSDGGKSEDT